MATPANFDAQPTPISQRPPAMPPKFLKKQIYTEPRVFKAIDDHAVNEARTNYRNFRDLIWNLIFKKNFNDLEKARVIFRWMTTKNMYTIMFDSELPGSPEAVLGGFKDGKTTYARIFECLSSFAGMHCMTISGWAKGVDYRPGMPITNGPINHSWNAVFLDGNWQLVDSHWATRYLQSERNTPENLVYEYDDFYFIPEPTQLVYSHCPEDPAWQLCYPARSRAEYEDYPLVKSYFFTVGMKFLQQDQGVIYTHKGILVLTLGYTKPAAFTFKLVYGDNSYENIQGVPLKRYIIQETTENRVSFYLRAPREGNYYLTVFSQQVQERLRLENIYKAVCEYKVVCDQAAPEIKPFPMCSDSNWGPGAPVKQYGLKPSQGTAILAAPNGRAEVVFQKTRPCRLYARLTKDGMLDNQLENCVSVREQDDKVHVAVNLPRPGEYGLEVYGNEPAREGDTFTHICQYLATYSDRNPRALYGQVYDRDDIAYGNSSEPIPYNYAPEQYASAAPGELQRSRPPGQKQVSKKIERETG